MGGARLIAIHKSRYYKTLEGLSLGPGPFVAALERASGVEAETVGKPEAAFFTSALEEMRCSPEETVMIGDVSSLMENSIPYCRYNICSLYSFISYITLTCIYTLIYSYSVLIYI